MPSIHSVAQAQHRKQKKIEYIENKFQEILKKDYVNQDIYKNENARNHELANLMTVMEEWFNIPFLLEDAERETPKRILKLYQDISNARKFDIY